LSDMEASRTITVCGDNGPIGTIDRADSVRRASVILRLDDGREMNVPAELLTPRDDGSYYLSLPVDQLEQASIGDATVQIDRSELLGDTDTMRDGESERIVIPVAVEEVEVGKRIVETGRVRISKKVTEHEELIEEPVVHEQVEVTRVPVGTYIDQPAEVRYEGETMIIPVVREVLVVEKRLMLEEEIHVVRRRIEEIDRRTVTLREETVAMKREEPGEKFEE
jgi:uncharacterized protein (TIGR02271 family)